MAEKATKEVKEEEKVRIRIPRTRKDEGDVYVSVNGRSWLIKRGEYVDVPKCVAKVLEHSERMMEIAYQFEESVKSGD